MKFYVAAALGALAFVEGLLCSPKIELKFDPRHDKMLEFKIRNPTFLPMYIKKTGNWKSDKIISYSLDDSIGNQNKHWIIKYDNVSKCLVEGEVLAPFSFSGPTILMIAEKENNNWKRPRMTWKEEVESDGLYQFIQDVAEYNISLELEYSRFNFWPLNKLTYSARAPLSKSASCIR